jgi:hypothetical protein
VRLADALQKLAAAWLRIRDRPPKEVEQALSQEYDLDEYHRTGGGVAPPDAPHIDDDGRI